MTLQDIFDALSSGELSQISIGGGSQGEITEENYPRILTHVNLGLTALYKRFDLKLGHFNLYLLQDQDTYVLDSRFVIGNVKSRESVRYIEQDLYLPFNDDILKVETIKTPEGVELPLNLGGNPLSVLTPSTATLYFPLELVNKDPSVPEEWRTDKVRVGYRANHPKLVVPLGYYEPEKVEVQLPYAYLEALLMFIAARVHAPVGMSGETQVGNVWFQRYEAECARLEAENLDIDMIAENTRAFRGGWV